MECAGPLYSSKEFKGRYSARGAISLRCGRVIVALKNDPREHLLPPP